MIMALVSRIATVLGGVAIAAAAAVGFAGTTNAAGLRPLDRPCASLTCNAASATVNAGLIMGIGDDTEFYQVRWSVNRGGAVQTYPQQQIARNQAGTFSYAAFGPIAAADRSAVVGLSVQSSSSGVFGSSCTGWYSDSIVPLPYGPDTCAAGHVWRDAFAGDHICVTPASRNQAASDHAAAAYRVNPNGAYGPNENADPNAHRA